jgi:hypothetical protein
VEPGLIGLTESTTTLLEGEHISSDERRRTGFVLSSSSREMVSAHVFSWCSQ